MTFSSSIAEDHQHGNAARDRETGTDYSFRRHYRQPVGRRYFSRRAGRFTIKYSFCVAHDVGRTEHQFQTMLLRRRL